MHFSYLRNKLVNKICIYRLTKLISIMESMYYSFDSEGYYDISKRQPTDPAGVLSTGVTVSDGYSNLFEAMCR